MAQSILVEITDAYLLKDPLTVTDVLWLAAVLGLKAEMTMEGKEGTIKLSRGPSIAQPTSENICGVGAPAKKKHPPASNKSTPKGRGAGKRGRPKVEGARPWEAEGVSRMTYYRRQKKDAAK